MEKRKDFSHPCEKIVLAFDIEEEFSSIRSNLIIVFKKMLSIQRSTRNIPTVKRDNFIQNFIISDK